MIILIFSLLTAFGLIIYCLQVAAVRGCISQPEAEAGVYMPPVSILKPLKGLDDSLYENLESFCRQDYPEYEIIFALRSTDDPAYRVALRIKEQFPARDISIVAEWCGEGLNPKVDTLVPAYRASRHGFVLISDSNVRVEKEYLKEIVKHMEDPGVGLVSSLIRGVGGRSIGSALENLHLNTFVVGGVCFLDRFFKVPCVVGKSMLFRREHLEELGGFGEVKDHLAEDYIFGRKMKQLGKKVVLSNHIINTVNESWHVRQFLARHIRWGKLRRQIGGAAYSLELIGNPVCMSLVPLLILGPSRMTLLLQFIAFSLKASGDYLMSRQVKAGVNPALYLLSPLKDFLIGMAWFVPIFSNKVEWRGDRYIIGKDSFLYPIASASAVQTLHTT